MALDLEPSRPNQNKPTWPTYPTFFPDPHELPSHLTYPPTWPAHPSVLPTYLIYPPTKITPLNPDNLPEPTDNLPEPIDNLPEPKDNFSLYILGLLSLKAWKSKKVGKSEKVG